MKPTAQVRSQGLQPDTEVLDFASRILGAIEVYQDLSRAHSRNNVMALETRGGEQLVAKWFTETSAYFRCLDALTTHTPPLGSSAPKLIDHNESLKAILMTRLPGRVVSREESLDPVVHFRLGELLRIFHESSHPTWSKNTHKDLAASLSRAIDAAQVDLGEFAAGELRALAMSVLDIERIPLQPIHGSIYPEHWMIDDNYGLQLLSFSASEYDPWIVDTKYLERDLWSYDPSLRKAFFSGYGTQPTPEDEIVLRASLAADALSGWSQAKNTRVSGKQRAVFWSRVEQVVGSTLF